MFMCSTNTEETPHWSQYKGSALRLLWKYFIWFLLLFLRALFWRGMKSPSVYWGITTWLVESDWTSRVTSHKWRRNYGPFLWSIEGLYFILFYSLTEITWFKRKLNMYMFMCYGIMFFLFFFFQKWDQSRAAHPFRKHKASHYVHKKSFCCCCCSPDRLKLTLRGGYRPNRNPAGIKTILSSVKLVAARKQCGQGVSERERKVWS